MERWIGLLYLWSGDVDGLDGYIYGVEIVRVKMRMEVRVRVREGLE